MPRERNITCTSSWKHLKSVAVPCTEDNMLTLHKYDNGKPLPHIAVQDLIANGDLKYDLIEPHKIEPHKTFSVQLLRKAKRTKHDKQSYTQSYVVDVDTAVDVLKTPESQGNAPAELWVTNEDPNKRPRLELVTELWE